jgi:hypothetical protein
MSYATNLTSSIAGNLDDDEEKANWKNENSGRSEAGRRQRRNRLARRYRKRSGVIGIARSCFEGGFGTQIRAERKREVEDNRFHSREQGTL